MHIPDEVLTIWYGPAAGGEVLAVDPPRFLSYTFQPAENSSTGGKPTRVVFELHPFGEVVTLTVTHDELPAGEPGARFLRDIGQGWSAVLSSLKTLLETSGPLAFPPPFTPEAFRPGLTAARPRDRSPAGRRAVRGPSARRQKYTSKKYASTRRGTVALTRPPEMFDRDAEWADLVAFAQDATMGVQLGVVSGRRRQGKTFLLYALAQATAGFYFAATEATEGESLRRLGRALAEHVSAPAPFQLESWEQAVDALLHLGRDRATTVVIDEFPYLVRASPSLPSVIQRALTPGRAEREGSRARLLLCGSALSFMGGLLSGSAPLRGRAGLELAVPTLDFRLAAQFWGAGDPRLAVQLHAVVGGTPAYRREYVRDDTPAGLDDFDDWVTRAVLSPTSPLFREARYLLAEEPDLRDHALYHSVLAAVADGNRSRGGIAGYIGRKATDLQHPLTVLEDAGLLTRDADPLRAAQGTYRIAEPLITFYQAVMRPAWPRLERRRAAEVWAGARRRFDSAVLGPHFENMCRSWLQDFAAADTVRGVVGSVGRTTLTDPDGRTSHEIDIVALGEPRHERRAVLGLGEVKWGERMGIGHLERLRRIRDIVSRRKNVDASEAVLFCASGTGFHADLLDAAGRGEVELVGLDRLYHGE